MTLFYRSFIELICTFYFICFFNQGKKQKITLTKICSSITGTQQRGLSELFNKQLKKAESILSDSTHPLHLHYIVFICLVCLFYLFTTAAEPIAPLGTNKVRLDMTHGDNTHSFIVSDEALS